jgi:mRNA interferase MazF
VNRGSIVIVDLGSPTGSAPAKRRPAVVIQDDRFNASGLSTTIVAAVSSQVRLAELPGNVYLPASATGLSKDSVALVTQLATIDESSISEHVGELPAVFLDDIDRGLRLVLTL